MITDPVFFPLAVNFNFRFRQIHCFINSNSIEKTGINIPWELNKKKLTGEYIAGFVQADGSFSVKLAGKTSKNKQYLHLSPVFTIVQNQKYKDLILEIKKKFGDVGHWRLDKKDKTIRYQVTSQNDLLNIIIPFFMKHQLRSGKLLSFLHFKYILQVMSTRAHWTDKKILLSLIVIASNLNPLGKLGNKIRYLTTQEQKYVINNVQPERVDISKLTDSIKNFVKNKLTLDFIHGLFDGDGNLSVSLIKSSTSKLVPSVSLKDAAIDKNKIFLKTNFTIAQDVHNISLLDEIKSYFNDTGFIYKLNNHCSIYNTGSRSDIMSVIIPKMTGKDSKELRLNFNIEELKLPLIKYNKIYFTYKILEYGFVDLSENKLVLNEIIRLSYYVMKNYDNLTLELYAKEMNRKLK